MSRDIIIAFDVMGGDLGSRSCISAALDFAACFPDTTLILYGYESEIYDHLSRVSVPSNIQTAFCSDAVAMHDDPVYALRKKHDSSMWQALSAVAQGKAHACVSAGNTGALVAMSRYLIKTLPGIKRPAICKSIPTFSGSSLLLDLGANIHCTAESLYNFAVMGCAKARVSGVVKPRVALLNIGSELSKGGGLVQSAASLLNQNQSGFEFVGFIEGDELYSGRVDVIVCDGFVGNVALKVSEGLVKHLMSNLDEYFNQVFIRRLVRIAIGPLLKRWSQKKNPSLYNGAAFLGLNAVVIKSHGSADILGLFKALEVAREHTILDVPKKVLESMQARACYVVPKN